MTRKTTYTRAHPGKFGLAIDWETSGSNFGGDSSEEYQGIAFGAIIFDTTTFEPVAELYRELHFDDKKYKWSDEAEKIHGLSREHLKEHGVPREEALVDLLELVMQYIGTESKIMFLGHNVDFDIDFTVQLAEDHGIELQIHHVKLETSGTAFILAGVYRSNDVFEAFLGQVREGKHNALQDAHMALEVVRNMKTIFAVGLENG